MKKTKTNDEYGFKLISIPKHALRSYQYKTPRGPTQMVVDRDATTKE